MTYDSLVAKLDEILFPLQYSMQLISGFGVIQDNSIWRLIGGRLLSKVLQAQSENFYSDATIYEALHKILLELDDPKGSKKGILQQFLAESWACGAGLSTIACRNSDSPPSKPTLCASCPLDHFPHGLSPRQAQKRLSELQYLRGELTRIEREFERMVASSAFVSLPQTQRAARLSGRYQGSQNIDSQLPDYLTNALSPDDQGQVPVAESDLAASAPPWLFRVLGGRLEGGYVTGMRIRRTVWRALVQRASTRNFGGASGHHAANDERIQNIRKLRSQVAEQFNAPDWLSLVWHRSAPGGRGPESPQKLVKEVLEPLRKKLLPLGKLEWVVLSEWAPPYLRIPPLLPKVPELREMAATKVLLDDRQQLLGGNSAEVMSVAAGFGTCLQHVISRTPSHMFTGLSAPLPGVTFAGSTGGIPVRDNFFLTHDLLQLLLLRSSSLRRSVFGEGHSMADSQKGPSWKSGAANVIGRHFLLPPPLCATQYSHWRIFDQG
ncbi:unnamed protein product [Dibothriocephalus latus]|uniref:Uncharacterized protein n=1 Tax=Dibothriocephalus latus TaxID=60516 RepID=A0A3P7NL97_DIBLA|nr:unnamed protein product [Dibothriocephalus latus]